MINSSSDLRSIEFPEIFIGLAAPIGSNLTEVIRCTSEYFSSRGYNVIEIKLTKAFDDLIKIVPPKISLQKKPESQRYSTSILYGNQVCEHFDSKEFFARYAVSKVFQGRDHRSEFKYRKTVYIFNQLKRKEEAELLRSVYGRLFFQISVYSRRGARVEYLSRKLAHSENSPDLNRMRAEAESLIQKDYDEIGTKYGQGLRRFFHDAEFIVNSDSRAPTIESQVNRFGELLFGSNALSPTKMEYGMFAAKAAALRSLDLSRQVGAAIFTSAAEILSMGSNEVPKAGGGTYWSDDDYDDREYKRGFDSNERRKAEVLSEFISAIGYEGVQPISPDDKRIKDTQFMDLLEYGRIVHAEMSALSDASRLGRPVKNAIMYVTTFPCHLCAKHIVASGVQEVVFLEPYPKRLAYDLHSDSIDVEGGDRGSYEEYPSVKFKHFHGVTPKRYRELFERAKRKSDGEFVKYMFEPPRPYVDIKLPLYETLEQMVSQAYQSLLKGSEATPSPLSLGADGLPTQTFFPHTPPPSA